MTYKEYRTRQNSANKAFWRERVYKSPKRAGKFRATNAARERSRRANMSQEERTTQRKKHADYERKRVAALSPHSRIIDRQIHADGECLRMRRLPAEKKAAIRAKRTERQREKRAAISDEEKTKRREKDTKRKRDKRTIRKQFSKKYRSYFKDKSNPMPLWLLCDLFMDTHNVDICEMDPFPKYHAFMVDFKGKALHHHMPRYDPSPETNFHMEMNKVL